MVYVLTYDLIECVTVEKFLVGPNVLAWVRAKIFHNFAPQSKKCGAKVNIRVLMVMVVAFWLLVIGPNTNLTANGHSCSSKNCPGGRGRRSVCIFASRIIYFETSM